MKITLLGIKPPIWRRLLVPANTSLATLSELILAVMGWAGGHLHLFDIDGGQYGDPKSVDEVADEKRLTIHGLLKSGVARFTYLYDFGDSWEHSIVIEKRMPAIIDSDEYPDCIDGKRNCPPEDCGGPPGYQELLEILADPDHPEYDHRRNWVGAIGEKFDPEDFSPERFNSLFEARPHRKIKS